MIVHHSRGSYPIEEQHFAEFLGSLPAEQPVFIDSSVAALWGHHLSHRLVYEVASGETSKSISEFERCLEWLAERRVTRDATLVAIGGGVVGDLVGFVAAAYMRGVQVVQVPTTLLAQVDSSVGGKVAVDLRGGKNLAGAFHPPVRVVVCPDALGTLAPRQLINGSAEVWKYGYIADSALLEELRRAPIAPGNPKMGEWVWRSIDIKRRIVEEDEFETTGLRATLNFGHTIGHSIEAELGYQDLLHGEAVAIGMVAEARLGEALGITPPGTAGDIERDMLSQGLPVAIPAVLDGERLLARMASDKKATQSGLAFSLIAGAGACKLCSEVDVRAVRRLLGLP
ncbi:MAG: 3-dehydroquinate synthase [Chthonomonas sp.]|nr:3-dehydroquinate synthase [Chthonomonas sp.]